MPDVPRVDKNDADLAPASGNINPNGVVRGKRGQLYTEVPGDGTARAWINTGSEDEKTWV